jgi:RNA-directed DNA polymerase
MTGKRQKMVQLRLAFPEESRGETPMASGGGTEPVMASRETESPAETERLMEEVCQRDNLVQALKRVQGNRGCPGMDGMTVHELPDHLREHWPTIREQLLAGTYKPQPVTRAEIRKRGGGGMRMLGIPTVLDRFIQQAVLQVLQPRWDPTFSEHSYGFRPGRSAHQAVAAAQGYIAEGYRWVVDLDLEKFFDQVCHDRLMAKAADRIDDKRLLKLLRAYLNAGVLEDGLVRPTTAGTPQGGPLSPLLSNLVLDELDRELERRGHRFARYADDGQIYVRSERAGHRVMASMTKFITNKLRLKVNEAKSAVARPWARKFLGFSFTSHKDPKRRLAPETVRRLRRRVRKLTWRTRGVSIEQMIGDLTRYLVGWRGYYGHCETPTVLEQLDSWIRRRLRAAIWKQWKHGRRRYKGLRAHGVGGALAAQTAGSSHGPWRIAQSPALNYAFPNAYWDSLGLPRLAPRPRA